MDLFILDSHLGIQGSEEQPLPNTTREVDAVPLFNACWNVQKSAGMGILILWHLPTKVHQSSHLGCNYQFSPHGNHGAGGGQCLLRLYAN